MGIPNNDLCKERQKQKQKQGKNIQKVETGMRKQNAMRSQEWWCETLLQPDITSQSQISKL